MPAERTVPALCGVCSAACGINLTLDEDDRLVRLVPRQGHPRGIVCTRGTRAPEIVHSPDRWQHPMRRVGERGEGRFERIGWDDAFELMVDGMRRIADRHGPEALVTYTGRGNFEQGLNLMFAPEGPRESSANAVLFPFGSPNATGVGSLCFVSIGMIAPRACFGEVYRDTHEDLEQADLVLVWGANPATASPPSNIRRLKDVQARGGRVVVIDHRRSETALALRADWLAIRPGTDGALALGLINLLVAAGAYDHEFVERWTHGFDELVAYTTTFTPDRVAAITGIPEDAIRELATAVGRARGLSILMYTGLEYSNSGVQAIRAVISLQALAGHLDSPGGRLLLPRDRVQLHALTTPAPVLAGGRPTIGAREFPVFHEVRNEAHGALLPRAILEGDPYPVRGMIVSGSSLLTSWPNPARWREALASLDLLVVLDRFETADAAYADLLLPATTMFEIESIAEYEGHVELRRRVIRPPGEARNDYLVFAELAQRLGYGDRWPQTERGLVETALTGTGITYDELVAAPDGLPLPRDPHVVRKWEHGRLRDDGRPGFRTPTGKFELASEWLRGHGHDALPIYTEPTEGPLGSPAVARTYPLVLNTGARIKADFRSQHRNIPTLSGMAPAPLVHLHEDDAAARGIAHGDEVLVISPRGAVPFRARVDRDIAPGVVEANMGGGGPLGPKAWRDANVNELTDLDNLDPISGFPVYKALLCEVRPAATALPVLELRVTPEPAAVPAPLPRATPAAPPEREVA